jgi:hypothetical protein
MTDSLKNESLEVQGSLVKDPLMAAVISKLNNQGTKIDKIYSALLGDEFCEEGLIKRVEKQEKRIKILEVVYIGGSAVIMVGGIILGMMDKISIAIK